MPKAFWDTFPPICLTSCVKHLTISSLNPSVLLLARLRLAVLSIFSHRTLFCVVLNKYFPADNSILNFYFIVKVMNFLNSSILSCWLVTVCASRHLLWALRVISLEQEGMENNQIACCPPTSVIANHNNIRFLIAKFSCLMLP